MRRDDQADEDQDQPGRLAGGREDGDEPPRPAGTARTSRTPQFERLITEVIVSGGPALLRLAASICPQDAEDILNVAAERALARPEAFAHGEAGKLYRWLERVVRNEALKTQRARRRELPTDPEALAKAPDESPGADPAAALASREERVATLEALGELHPVQAGCLALSARGYRRAEIAEMLGITPLTVKRRLAQGRAALGLFGDELASGRRCARLRPALSDYLDRILEGPELRRLERHLDHCGRCRGHLVALRRQRSRIASALPPALLLSVAEMAADEGDLQVGRQIAEAAHDGWLALSGGFMSRVLEGWHALSPLGRLAGTGAAVLLALAGVGTLSGGERAPVPAGAQAREGSEAVASGTARRSDAEQGPRAGAQPRPTQRRSAARTAPRRRAPVKPTEAKPRSSPTTPTHSAAASSRAGGSSQPGVSSGGSDQPARAEFEPGPP